MSMWDNDAPADAPLTRVAPAAGAGASGVDTCATCDRPAPPGKLRCDLCVSVEWDRLRAAHGDDWYTRHRAYRRQTAGGDT